MRKPETWSFFNARHRGSSQLIRNERIRPDAIHDPIVLRDASDEYMYLDCIVFIKKAKLVQRRTLMLNHLTIEIRIQQVKRGNLGETSPLLNDISSVPTWDKINSGLLRMYKVCGLTNDN